jgi:chromosome segregation ATPase
MNCEQTLAEETANRILSRLEPQFGAWVEKDKMVAEMVREALASETARANAHQKANAELHERISEMAAQVAAANEAGRVVAEHYAEQAKRIAELEARIAKQGCARDQKTTQFCHEAVDAIRERDELRRQLEDEKQKYSAAYFAWRKQVTTLRDALTEVCHQFPLEGPCRGEAMAIARAALAATAPTESATP